MKRGELWIRVKILQIFDSLAANGVCKDIEDKGFNEFVVELGTTMVMGCKAITESGESLLPFCVGTAGLTFLAGAVYVRDYGIPDALKAIPKVEEIRRRRE